MEANDKLVVGPLLASQPLPVNSRPALSRQCVLPATRGPSHLQPSHRSHARDGPKSKSAACPTTKCSRANVRSHRRSHPASAPKHPVGPLGSLRGSLAPAASVQPIDHRSDVATVNRVSLPHRQSLTFRPAATGFARRLGSRCRTLIGGSPSTSSTVWTGAASSTPTSPTWHARSASTGCESSASSRRFARSDRRRLRRGTFASAFSCRWIATATGRSSRSHSASSPSSSRRSRLAVTPPSLRRSASHGPQVEEVRVLLRSLRPPVGLDAEAGAPRSWWRSSSPSDRTSPACTTWPCRRPNGLVSHSVHSTSGWRATAPC